MRTIPKIKLIKQDHHRNGCSGVPFDVAIFKDLDENKTMFAVQFNEYDEPYTAVFDLDLLKKDVIEFFDNSWRGDVYHEPLKKLLKD